MAHPRREASYSSSREDLSSHGETGAPPSLGERGQFEKATLDGSKYMAFWERKGKTIHKVERTVVSSGSLGEEGRKISEVQEIWGDSKTVL